MDINQNADSAARGVSDISGVKNVSLSCPEGENEDGLRVADGENETGVAGTDEATLDEEFERLIQGRYKEAYKKRTESIIRRRLKAGKARPEHAIHHIHNMPNGTAVSAVTVGARGVLVWQRRGDADCWSCTRHL